MPLNPTISGDLNTGQLINTTIDKIKGVSLPATLTPGVLTYEDNTWRLKADTNLYFVDATSTDMNMSKYTGWGSTYYTNSSPYTVLRNDNNVFNATTGIYTCPATGTYYCSVRVKLNTSGRCFGGLFANGVIGYEIYDVPDGTNLDLQAFMYFNRGVGDKIELLRSQQGNPSVFNITIYKLPV